MPPWGGGPYLNASSRKPNFALRVLVAEAERAEHARLHVGAMDPDRAAGDLVAVEHEVVGARAHRARVALEALEVRRAWGDVNGWCARDQLAVVGCSNSGKSVIQQNCHLCPCCGSGRACRPRCRRRPPSTAFDQLLGAELQEQKIAVAEAAPACVDRAAQVLGDRLHRALRHAPPSPMRARARPRAPKPLANSSSLSRSARDSALACAAGSRQPLTMPPGVLTARLQQADAAAVVPRDDLGQVDERQLEAQVGLVRAVLVHRLGVAEAQERARELDAEHVLPERRHQASRSMPCTSSSTTKHISRSICVNSGWRSRRRSSSRKQRTIWK